MKWKVLQPNGADVDVFEQSVYADIATDEMDGIAAVYRTLKGDDDFLDREDDKLAAFHAQLLVDAPVLLSVLREALEQTRCDGDLCAYRWHEQAREVIRRIEE